MTAPASPPLAAPSPPAARPPWRPSARLRAALLLAITAAYLAGALPPALHLGTNIEEVAGLLSTRPLREYPDKRLVAAPPPAPLTLRESRWMPVYSLVLGADAELPLMVDGHIGAAPYWPYWPLAAMGGLVGARLLSLLLGLLTIAATMALARRLRDERTAWVTGGLLATTPMLSFITSWIHPDEVWSFLGIVLALLTWLRFAAEGRTHQLLAAALLAGLAIAAKNTALWSVVGVSATGLALRLVPRLTPARWALAVAAFLVPLLPQLLFLAVGPEASSFGRRLKVISSPLDVFDPARLAFFFEHFADTYGGLGSYMAPFISGPGGPSWAPLWGAGGLTALVVLACCAAPLSRRLPRGQRAFGLALGLVLLQYVTFYYAGMSLFALVLPAVPVALALVGVGAWDRLARLARPAARRLLRGALLGLGLLLLANNVGQTALYGRATARVGYTIFDQASQRALAADLAAAGVARPWTTTYGVIGVFEFFTDNAVRPAHAFPMFTDLRHLPIQATWARVLERMGPGRHDVIVTPDPSALDVSPLEDGAALAATLPAAVAAAGGTSQLHREYPLASGAVGFRWLRVTLPARAR